MIFLVGVKCLAFSLKKFFHRSMASDEKFKGLSIIKKNLVDIISTFLPSSRLGVTGEGRVGRIFQFFHTFPLGGGGLR